MEKISLLHPTGHGDDYTQLSDVAVHDLGVDAICEQLSDKEPERHQNYLQYTYAQAGE